MGPNHQHDYFIFLQLPTAHRIVHERGHVVSLQWDSLMCAQEHHVNELLARPTLHAGELPRPRAEKRPSDELVNLRRAHSSTYSYEYLGSQSS